MGDDGYISTDSTSDSRRENCPYMTEKRDCDGDWDTWCIQPSGNCPYKRDMRDCDGDQISLCRY